MSKVGRLHREIRGADEQAYLLLGDIPYPYPTKGNALSGGWAVDYIDASPGVASLDPVFMECWKQCPICLRIDLGSLGAEFCHSCEVKAGAVLEGWITGTLDTPEDFAMLPKIINLEVFLKMGGNVDDLRDLPDFERGFELLPKLLNREFFKVGHKSRQLREAYAAARSARFEHGASGSSF